MASASTIELSSRARRPPPPLNNVRFFTEEQQPPVGPTDHFPRPIPFEDEALKIQPPWKRTLYQLLEQPTSSSGAFAIHIITTFLIVFSAVVTIIETVPAVHMISGRVWFGLESSIVALFTVEYIARCLAWSFSWKSLFSWIFSFYGIIDLLSVVPYYVELMLQQDTSVYFRFSILRVFRLLRVFRPFRYNHTILLTIEVMYLSVRRSQHALLAIGFFVLMVLTIFSTLLYFAERGVWDEVLGTFINAEGDPSQFSSIPAAAWFVVVTISTVGYGEITPKSFLGRLITLPILVCGLLLITLPSFVLGREFSHVWEKLTRDSALENTNPPISPIYSSRPRPSSDASYPPPPRPHPHSNPLSHTNPPFSHPPVPPQTPRDLSNFKLAQNQTELSRQITELASAVSAQGKALESLLSRMGGVDEKAGLRHRGSGSGELVDAGQ